MGTVLGEDIGAYVENEQDRAVPRAGWGILSDPIHQLL